VISRALGADQAVDVDMKTMEVEEGTEFLLCTDGITRHVSDNEIRQLMVVTNNTDDLCNELKRRCYDRGAEDNLTVVVVRVGEHLRSDERLDDLEPTISPDTQPVYAVPSGNGSAGPESTFVPASRIAFPGPPPADKPVAAEPLNVAAPEAKQGGGGGARAFVFLLVLVLIAAAFYAGARFKERIPFLATKTQPVQVAPAAANTTPAEEPFVQFERTRRQVDKDPRAWLATDIGKELLNSQVQSPLDSPNAEFLYLYGRANLLTGNTDEAGKAFDAAIVRADANPSPANATIKKEAILGLGVISARTGTQRDLWKVRNHYEELTKPPANTNAP
jgi:hypothetical protein